MNSDFEWTPALRNAYQYLTKSIKDRKNQISQASQIVNNASMSPPDDQSKNAALKFLDSVLESRDDGNLEERIKQTIRSLNSESDLYAFPNPENIRKLEETAKMLTELNPTLEETVAANIDLRSPDEKFRVNRIKVLSSYPPPQEPVFEPDLPYPWVKYPHGKSIVCAFAKSADGPFAACACSLTPLKNWAILKERQYIRRIEMNSTMLGKNYHEEGYLVSDVWNREVNELFWYDAEADELDLTRFTFVEAICHQCVGVLPIRDLADETPWNLYIRQEHTRFGLTEATFYDDYLEDQLNETLKELMEQGLKAQNLYMDFHNGSTPIDRNRAWDEWTIERKRLERQRTYIDDQIRRYFENKVRRSFGLDDFGRGSLPEYKMYLILKRLYKETELQRNVHPDWLDGLELDVWIPEFSIAFEYQGEQHFNAIEHWGGKEELAKTQERDKRKKELCQDYGVKLICINYDDPLDEAFLSKLIDSAS